MTSSRRRAWHEEKSSPVPVGDLLSYAGHAVSGWAGRNTTEHLGLLNSGLRPEHNLTVVKGNVCVAALHPQCLAVPGCLFATEGCLPAGVLGAVPSGFGVRPGGGFLSTSPGRADREAACAGQFIQFCLAFVGDPLAFVGDLLAFVGDLLAFVGDLLAFVGDLLAFVGDLLMLVSDAVALVADPSPPLTSAAARAGSAGVHICKHAVPTRQSRGRLTQQNRGRLRPGSRVRVRRG